MPRDFVGRFNVSSDLSFARGVLLLEDCEGTFTWRTSGTGVGWASTFETAAAFFGTKGMQVLTRIGTPAEDDISVATRGLPAPVQEVMTLRWRMSAPDVSVVKRMLVEMVFRDGAKEWRGGIEYRPNEPVWNYRNSAGGVTAITGAVNSISDADWVQGEFTLDLKAHQYTEARLQGRIHPMVGVAMQEVGASTDRMAHVQVTVYAAGAVQAIAYFDNIYVGEFQDV